MFPDNQAYFENLRELVIVTDNQMVCQYVNPAFCELFGKTRDHWVGRNFQPDHLENCEIASPPAEDERAEPRLLMKFTHGKKPVWVEWLKTRVNDNTQVLTGRNITGRKENETSLKKLAAAADEVSNAKMRFLATMSHEMRTPLNGILGMTGLLLDSDIEPSQRAYADAIRESGSALLSLINDILDYSKVESGKLELEELTFDPRSLVQGVFELLSPRATHKGLEVATYVDPSVPLKLLGDEGRLRQILLNLVGNAVKFTENGGVTLEVYSKPAGQEGFATIDMSVRDSGIGIPETALDKIFDEFAQADSSHARKYEGTGLGLAIARRIAGAMGGTISVRSAVGKGSTFTVSVPVKVQEENTPLTDDALIDDPVVVLTSSPILIRNLRLQLKAVGVQQAYFAESVVQCQEFLAAHEKATLLCDLQFATMHGQKLTRLSEHAIVLLSPMARGRLDAYRKAGFGGYLVKPIRQSSLREWLIDKTPMPQPTPARERPALPESAVKVPETPEPPAVDETPPADPAGKRKLKLLLAEDNKINALLATSIIKQAGHEVDVAENGKLALEQLQAGNYDLVLMDMRMPEMDGLDATRNIRKLEGRLAETPIIALTANAMKSDRETCLDAGMDDFMTKPFDPEDLLQVIEKWVSTKSAAVRDETAA